MKNFHTNPWHFVRRIYELFALFAFHFVNRKIGQELSEDEGFTKPKHRIIADAYAKRGDDRIEVSYQKPFTDPANINFDMIDLNVTESDPMGETLTNYLSKIINRRNGVGDLTCENYASSCADSHSEISLSVRQVSLESRRSSIDSTVSQVSVKVSETNFKATLNAHSQKHKGLKMKSKRRQRNLTAKQTIRRASSSSVESQRITSQLKNIKYKNPNSQLNGNAVGRQSERRPACTTADINAINQIFKKIPLTSDEDQRNDDAQPMQMMVDPTKMLAPFDGQMINSVDSLDQASTLRQLEDLLRLSNKQQDYKHNNARNNVKYGKNQRYPSQNMYLHSNQKKNDQILSKIRNEHNLSMSSSMDIDLFHHHHADGNHENRNSLSDHSMNRLKTHSQNSKRSCDIGIQANDYDITSHAQQPSNGHEYDKDDVPEKFQSNYQHDDKFTETDELLPQRKRDIPSIVRRDILSGRQLSRSEIDEQVNKLLLP